MPSVSRDSAITATSSAARFPVSIAPFMYPCQRSLVCSPAKTMRPAGRASQGRSAGIEARIEHRVAALRPRDRDPTRWSSACEQARRPAEPGQPPHQRRATRASRDRVLHVARGIAAGEQAEDAGAAATAARCRPTPRRSADRCRTRSAGRRCFQNRRSNCSRTRVAGPYRSVAIARHCGSGSAGVEGDLAQRRRRQRHRRRSRRSAAAPAPSSMPTRSTRAAPCDARHRGAEDDAAAQAARPARHGSASLPSRRRKHLAFAGNLVGRELIDQLQQRETARGRRERTRAALASRRRAPASRRGARHPVGDRLPRRATGRPPSPTACLRPCTCGDLRRQPFADALEGVGLRCALSCGRRATNRRSPSPCGESGRSRGRTPRGESSTCDCSASIRSAPASGVLPVREAAQRVHPPADAVARLDDGDLGAGALEIARRGQPGQTRSRDDHPSRSHRSSISRSFDRQLPRRAFNRRGQGRSGEAACSKLLARSAVRYCGKVPQDQNR